jgi:hypothetical protein
MGNPNIGKGASQFSIMNIGNNAVGGNPVSSLNLGTGLGGIGGS